jgi:hypothetical protein
MKKRSTLSTEPFRPESETTESKKSRSKRLHEDIAPAPITERDPPQVHKRTKRSAAIDANERIHEQTLAESSTSLSTATISLPVTSSFSSGAALMYRLSAKSGKSGTITNLSVVPPALIIRSIAGVRETPTLYTAPLPTRSQDNIFSFKSHPIFKPNVSPEEVLRAGSFGGTYFRTIASGVTGKVHADAYLELPKEWLTGLNVSKVISSPRYDVKVNKYKVKSGQDLREWESSDWIKHQDPFGFFQWYCRFFQGRRTDDDERQVARWCACAGEKGRWKANLAHKVAASGKDVDDPTVSPVVRQTLLHWGYKLTLEDLNEGKRKLKAGLGAPYVKG